MHLMRMGILVAVVLVTLPFGFYRAYTRRLSLRWFLAIHLPVPLVFLARVEAHLSYTFIPFTCLAFAAAQFLGCRAGRWWIRRHPTAPATAEGGAPPGREPTPSAQGVRRDD
jgi:hypothetical protein